MKDKLQAVELPAGSVVFMDGVFVEMRNTIKSKLKRLGVNVKTTCDDSVTHIVLGRNPAEGWRIIAEKKLPYLTETTLYPLLRELDAEEQFLLQEEKAGEGQMAESLKAMLTSPDANTLQIALLMVKQGGLPFQLAEELLIVAKTNEDVKVRGEARKLLLTQGPPEWAELVKDKQVFANIQTLKQKETREKLKAMAKNTGADDAAFLSALFFKYFGRGAAYALSQKRNKWRIEVLRMLTKDGVLDFHAGVGYHNWKEDSGSTYWPSQKIDTGIAFPSDHPDPLSIKVLNLHNCKISAISNEVAVFVNCEEIDASHNAITGLHPSLAKLVKLRKLNLAGNKLSEFPQVLLKMPSLRELDLRVEAGNYRENPVPNIPPEFRQACPQCEVLT